MKLQTDKEKKNIPLLGRKPEDDAKPVSYIHAKKIGIIYESPRGEDIQEINNLIKELNNDGKEVYSLKYITVSLSREYMADINANTLKRYTLSKKDINIFRRPKKKAVRGFIETWFDIVIYFSVTDIFSMHYLASLCRSRLKVAPYNEKYLKYYPLMIDIKGEKNLSLMIESIMKYIKMLNNTEI